jgi:hypothetical protein
VRRLAVRLNKVRHPDDFILLVILDHIRLLDDGHEILGIAGLSLQTFPDLVCPEVSVYQLAWKKTILRSPSPPDIQPERTKGEEAAYLIPTQNRLNTLRIDLLGISAVNMHHDCWLPGKRLGRESRFRFAFPLQAVADCFVDDKDLLITGPQASCTSGRFLGGRLVWP